MHYSAKERLELKESVNSELLDSWQTVSCIAERSGVSAKLAAVLLAEIRDDGEAIMTSAWLGRKCGRGTNKVLFYKRNNKKYYNFLGLRVELKNNDIYHHEP